MSASCLSCVPCLRLAAPPSLVCHVSALSFVRHVSDVCPSCVHLCPSCVCLGRVSKLCPPSASAFRLWPHLQTLPAMHPPCLGLVCPLLALPPDLVCHVSALLFVHHLSAKALPLDFGLLWSRAIASSRKIPLTTWIWPKRSNFFVKKKKWGGNKLNERGNACLVDLFTWVRLCPSLLFTFVILPSTTVH